MRKIFLVALKDLKLAFRDRAALIFMLLAPFALTLGLGLATGRFSGNTNTGLADIPVVIVNEDGGALGNAIEEMMRSEELADLVEPQVASDVSGARALVDSNQAAAMILVPEGFTRSIIPVEGQALSTDVVELELYSNPTMPTSAGVIKNILEQFITHVEVGRIGGTVTVTQMLTNGIIDPAEALAVGRAMGEAKAEKFDETSSIKLNSVTASGEDVKFDVLGFLAPGMALMFLMYTVSYGGRSLLVEQAGGTLTRLLVSPTHSAQVLGGKVFGIFLTGTAQLLILIVGTTLLFRLDWGDPLGVLLLTLAASLGATGWGILMAALFKTPGQVSAIGTAMMLIFGILGGSFTNADILPDWVQFISRITPNRWGLDGFTTLSLGGSLQNVLTSILALLVMAVVLFTAAVILFSRRGIGKH